LTNPKFRNIIFIMKTLMMGEFKEKFSEVLEIVKHGEEVTIKSDKKEENIALISGRSLFFS
jgi:antitoxin (DNA-binding transcriptional repressor) of toxin-antitoxin stability system